MDVHPPLARLLVTLSAWLGGFTGDFTFYDIGADYVKHNVPYVMMRSFTATLGALVVPIGYVTLRAVGVNNMIATLAAFMLLFDNALTCQSRLILLDSYLVFFTATTTMFWSLFRLERHAPFRAKWWTWLALTGLSLGLVASCKWVGLFVVAVVGLYTITDLWTTFGDVSVPLVPFVFSLVWSGQPNTHILGNGGETLCGEVVVSDRIAFYGVCSLFLRSLCLVDKLEHWSNGNVDWLSRDLEGWISTASPQRYCSLMIYIQIHIVDVYFGSIITLRQSKSEGGYLHSHAHMYPEGSKQQQVTAYHHRDENNKFLIRRAFIQNETYKTEASMVDEQEAEITTLKHGDLIRLEHIMTGRFLHSHPVQAPVADKDHNFEVSGYGHHPSKFSDLNDNWRVENVDQNGDPVGKNGDPIHAVTGKIRLVHANMGCVLNCANRNLPEWGFRQAEVTCGRETKKTNSIWFIETNEHPKSMIFLLYQHILT